MQVRKGRPHKGEAKTTVNWQLRIPVAMHEELASFLAPNERAAWVREAIAEALQVRRLISERPGAELSAALLRVDGARQRERAFAVELTPADYSDEGQWDYVGGEFRPILRVDGPEPTYRSPAEELKVAAGARFFRPPPFPEEGSEPALGESRRCTREELEEMLAGVVGFDANGSEVES